MTYLKPIISSLVLNFGLCLLPFSGFSQYVLTDDDVTVTDGEIISCSYEGGGHISIPSVLDGQNITSLGFNSFNGLSLTQVDLPASLVVIGAQTFWQNEIESVVIPEGVTTIERFAFATNNITSVSLSSSIDYMDTHVFYQNADLDYVILPDSELGYTWLNEDGELIEAGQQINDFTVWYALVDNNEHTLTDDEVEVIDGTIVSTTLEKRYSNINIPSELDGQQVIGFDQSVFSSLFLNRVVLPEGLQTIGFSAFSSNAIVSIDFPSTLKTIENTAFVHNVISSVTLPASLRKVGSFAFGYNPVSSFSLPIVDIGGEWIGSDGHTYEDGALVTSLDISYNYLFLDDYTLTDDDVEVEEGSIVSVTLPDAYTNIIIPNELDGQLIESIGYSAFANMPISSIVLPEELVNVGSYAFSNNILSEVILGPNVRFVGNHAFNNNPLTSFTLPVSSNENDFWVSSHQTVHEPESEVPPYRSYTLVSSEPYELKDEDVVVIEGEIRVYSMEEIYSNIIIPSELDGQTVTSIGSNPFREKLLTSVTFPETLLILNNGSFQRNAITNLVLNEGLLEIGNRSFSDNSLTQVTLPESLQKIGDRAFFNNSLQEVNLGNGVSEIESHAFFSHTNSDELVITFPELTAREGYTYNSWESSNGSLHIPGSEMADLTLGYTYEENTIIDYDITYHDGFEHDNPTNYTVESETINLSDSEREAYEFMGWYGDVLFNEPITAVVSGSIGDMDIYAAWSPIEYDITYHNSFAHYNPNIYTIESETFSFSDPFRGDGYSFEGWYVDELFTITIEEISTGSIGDKDIYTKWETIDYTISYHGADAIENPSSYNVESETIDLILHESNEVGYNFLWYTDGELQNPISSIESGSTGNLDLYGDWTAINYSITYHDAFENENPDTYTIESVTIDLGNPSREGYTFEGWYSDAGLTISISEISTGSIGNVDIYADWSVIEYTITYNNAFDNNNPATYNVETETINLTDPIREEYNFAGWYSDLEFTNQVKMVEQGTTGDLELYAKWEKVLDVDLRNQNQVLIYPNPTSQYFYLSEKVDQIHIYDLMGNLQKRFSISYERYDVSELSAGSYVIIIGRENEIFTKRLVLN